LNDYTDIRRLGIAHGLDVPPYEDWSALWLDNPVRTRGGKEYPIGWVLQTDAGEIVGCMGTVHSPYTFRGERLIAAVARAWFVPVDYRGYGLELMEAYLDQPGVDLVLNNAVSNAAHDAFRQFCRRVPLGEWDTISYWVTGFDGYAQRALSCGIELDSELVACQPLPESRGSFAVQFVDRFDPRFDAFWNELVRENPHKLLAERSADALAWHFAAPMRERRLWILTASRNGKLLAYCTFTRQDHGFRLPALPHNDTQGIRGMRLVDYQSIDTEVDFLSAFLHAALERCTEEDLYVLEMLGSGVPKMRIVDDCAPRRKRLENWKFYYRAADSALDAELRRPECWDPSGYDGDVSFE
jgi:hypothetical protein